MNKGGGAASWVRQPPASSRQSSSSQYQPINHQVFAPRSGAYGPVGVRNPFHPPLESRHYGPMEAHSRQADSYQNHPEYAPEPRASSRASHFRQSGGATSKRTSALPQSSSSREQEFHPDRGQICDNFEHLPFEMAGLRLESNGPGCPQNTSSREGAEYFRCGQVLVPIACRCSGERPGQARGTQNGNRGVRQTCSAEEMELLKGVESVLGRALNRQENQAASGGPVDIPDGYTAMLRKESIGTWQNMLIKSDEYAHEEQQMDNLGRCPVLKLTEHTGVENKRAVALYMSGKADDSKAALKQLLLRDPENLLALIHLVHIEGETSHPHLVRGEGHLERAARLGYKYRQAEKNPLNQIASISEMGSIYSHLNPYYFGLSLQRYSEAYHQLQKYSGPPNCTVRVLYLNIAIGYATCAYRLAKISAPHPTLPALTPLQSSTIFLQCKEFLHKVCTYFANEAPHNARAWILWSLVYYEFSTKLPKYFMASSVTAADISRYTVHSNELSEYDQSNWVLLMECRSRSCGFRASGAPNLCTISHQSPVPQETPNAGSPIQQAIPLCVHQMTRLSTVNAILHLEMWDAFTASRIARNISTLGHFYLAPPEIPSVEETTSQHKAYFQNIFPELARQHRILMPFLQDLQFEMNGLESYIQHAEMYLLLSLHARIGALALHSLASVYAKACREFHKPRMPKILLAQWFPIGNTQASGVGSYTDNNNELLTPTQGVNF